LFIGESGFLQGREVTKRAESSSFAKGRLEPKAAPTVIFMTQELLAVILEQKSYNTLKVPVFGGLKQKNRERARFHRFTDDPVGAGPLAIE